MVVAWYNPFPDNENFDGEIANYIHYAERREHKRPKTYANCTYDRNKKNQLRQLKPDRLYIIGHTNFDAGHITGDETPEDTKHEGFVLQNHREGKYRLALTPGMLATQLREHEGLGREYAVPDLRIWGCKGARDRQNGFAKKFATLAYQDPRIAVIVSGYKDLLTLGKKKSASLDEYSGPIGGASKSRHQFPPPKLVAGTETVLERISRQGTGLPPRAPAVTGSTTSDDENPFASPRPARPPSPLPRSSSWGDFAVLPDAEEFFK